MGTTILGIWREKMIIYNNYRTDFWFMSLTLLSELLLFFLRQQNWNDWPASGRPLIWEKRRPLAEVKKRMSTHKVLLILRLECRMITKIFSCVLWVLMHIQLIWYAKVSFSRKDTQLQTFLNDKIQKGCTVIFLYKCKGLKMVPTVRKTKNLFFSVFSRIQP